MHRVQGLDEGGVGADLEQPGPPVDLPFETVGLDPLAVRALVVGFEDELALRGVGLVVDRQVEAVHGQVEVGHHLAHRQRGIAPSEDFLMAGREIGRGIRGAVDGQQEQEGAIGLPGFVDEGDGGGERGLAAEHRALRGDPAQGLGGDVQADGVDIDLRRIDVLDHVALALGGGELVQGEVRLAVGPDPAQEVRLLADLDPADETETAGPGELFLEVARPAVAGEQVEGDVAYAQHVDGAAPAPEAELVDAQARHEVAFDLAAFILQGLLHVVVDGADLLEAGQRAEQQAREQYRCHPDGDVSP